MPIVVAGDLVHASGVSESGFNPGPPQETKWGCIAAFVFSAPLFGFLFLADTLGDCAPDTDCRKGFLPFVLAPTIIAFAIVFFSVRWLVALWRSRTHK